ncbi:glucose sorbosone dehydrogenase [Enemella dayhoffiae]|uniref:Glucose sorbosone dehydrogenase n=1 Tax=Enemella dayhoffiae TaxID=2016507 RepID=A0A255HD04_9ACTN|nr:PQQ-dependent sugar dehydrogenase [Enemella dayhoffiae]OYO25316.1 glucose sorbosone dehydrogenase [Enemella dayhoffiae]
MPTRPATLLGALPAALLLVACSPGPGVQDPQPSTPVQTAPTPSAAPATPTGSPSQPATPGQAPSTPAQAPLPAGDFETDLDVPWGLARMPDGSVLVTERDTAQVLRLALGKSVILGQVPGVRPNGEGGLHGIAVDPTDPQVFFVHFAAGSDNKVARLRLAGTGFTVERVIVEGIPAAAIHNGGRLAFGPDGFLYIATGDGNRTGNAQDRNSLGGKILRVDRDGNSPPGNPFGNSVWTLGHRNVQGLAWDQQGRMFASEFGQNRFDEVNLIEPGRNYGWPRVEGMGNDPAYTNPLHVWGTDDASPSGLAYLNGNLWMAALKGQGVWRIPLDGGAPEKLLTDRGRIRTIEPTGDGGLFVVTSNTYRGTPKAGDDRIIVWRP